MKKISPKNKPSNLKTSQQNISDVGRSSQGGPRHTPISARGKKFLKEAKTRQPKNKKYSLGDAMRELGGK